MSEHHKKKFIKYEEKEGKVATNGEEDERMGVVGRKFQLLFDRGACRHVTLDSLFWDKCNV